MLYNILGYNFKLYNIKLNYTETKNIIQNTICLNNTAITVYVNLFVYCIMLNQIYREMMIEMILWRIGIGVVLLYLIFRQTHMSTCHEWGHQAWQRVLISSTKRNWPWKIIHKKFYEYP